MRRSITQLVQLLPALFQFKMQALIPANRFVKFPGRFPRRRVWLHWRGRQPPDLCAHRVDGAFRGRINTATLTGYLAGILKTDLANVAESLAVLPPAGAILDQPALALAAQPDAERLLGSVRVAIGRFPVPPCALI